MSPFDAAVRRAVDIGVASVLLAATAPLLVVSALAVAAVSSGPLWYRQRRVGRGQRTFVLYKLRTMHPDADAMLERYLHAHPEERREWNAYARLKQDPRVVPGVGRVLRRFSIDELPQLINVVAGHMTLVGPRPLEPFVAAGVDEAAMAERSRVPPGITGLWQISGRSEVTIAEMIALDRQYLRTRSLKGDLAILLRTPAAVLSGRGAY